MRISIWSKTNENLQNKVLLIINVTQCQKIHKFKFSCVFIKHFKNTYTNAFFFTIFYLREFLIFVFRKCLTLFIGKIIKYIFFFLENNDLKCLITIGSSV